MPPKNGAFERRFLVHSARLVIVLLNYKPEANTKRIGDERDFMAVCKHNASQRAYLKEKPPVR